MEGDGGVEGGVGREIGAGDVISVCLFAFSDFFTMFVSDEMMIGGFIYLYIY